jgi:hypothetical protein
MLLLIHDVSNNEARYMALLKECEVRWCVAAINIAPRWGAARCKQMGLKTSQP